MYSHDHMIKTRSMIHIPVPLPSLRVQRRVVAMTHHDMALMSTLSDQAAEGDGGISFTLSPVL